MSNLPQFKPKFIAYGIAAIIGFSALNSSFYTVKSGTKAIVFTFGNISSVEGEGLHMKIPFIQSTQVVDIRTQKTTSPSDAGTKDLQQVTAQVALNYHLNDNKLKEIYSKTGLDVNEKIIEQRIQEIVKSVAAKYTAEQLLIQREAVKNEISSLLKINLSSYNIVLEDVQITNFRFSKAFNDAIEAKQTSVQQALKAENDLQRIRIEAEQKIAMARAEAESIRIQSEAIKAQGGVEYVQLKAIEKWDGNLPTTMAGGVTPFINIK